MVQARIEKWKWVLVFGAYTFVGLFFFGQNSLSYILEQDPIPWGRVFFSEMLYWYIWFGLTPLIFWYSRRITINKRHWRKGVLAHFLLSILIAPLQNGLWYFFHFLLIAGISLTEIMESLPEFIDGYLVGIITGFYKYWLLIGAYYGINYYFQFRQQEKKTSELRLQSARLKSQLAQSRLDVLKMQLHPHFLFNSMNTISVYMKENVNKAQRMLLRLSDLLRITLESKDVQEVPLGKEIDILNHYLEVEKARFEDELEIEWDLDPSTLEGAIPYLILQPITENAIHHGIFTNRGGGKVTISSLKENRRLIIKVRDNGIGTASTDQSRGNGIGLHNTRERLHQLYEDDHLFRINSSGGLGTEVTISIPFRKLSGTELSDHKDE